MSSMRGNRNGNDRFGWGVGEGDGYDEGVRGRSLRLAINSSGNGSRGAGDGAPDGLAAARLTCQF
jgi:hypothetical protein